MAQGAMIAAAFVALALPVAAGAQTITPLIPPAEVAAPATAPDTQNHGERLGDLRLRLNAVRADLQSLRDELRGGGATGYQALGGPDKAIKRMDRLEAELTRLTAKTDQMSNQITRTLNQSRTRMDDLEFRLCEMETSCDLGALTTPTTVSAPDVTRGAATATSRQSATAEEQAAFNKAKDALAVDPTQAVKLFAAFQENFPASPLAISAMMAEGQAAAQSDDPLGAARAWLTAFAAQPNGPEAPAALLGVARALAKGGANPDRACHYLAELGARFPNAPQATEAANESTALNCAAIDTPMNGGEDISAENSGLQGVPVDGPAPVTNAPHPAADAGEPLPFSPNDPEAAADEAAGLTGPATN